MNSAMSVQLKRVCVCCVVLGMTACVSGAYTNGASDGDGTPWYENVDVSFDLTLRQEAVDTDYPLSYAARGTRNSSQYEAHLNIHSQIKDNVSANLQLATGYSSVMSQTSVAGMPITSHYQSFGDQFSSKDVWFSQVYLNWQPSQVPGADVFAGKIPNIFERVGGNQVIWDEDVNPEGVGVNFLRSLDDSTNFHANVGVFAVEEAWGPAPPVPAGDVTLFAGQLAVDRQFNETACGLAGVSYYSYSNIVNQGGFAHGNSQTGTPSRLANDFDLLELFAEINSEINGMPCMVFGTFINNVGADTMGADTGENGDTAWSIGGRINKAEEPGSWEVGYDYRDIEADSIVGNFTDDAFGGTGSGGRGSSGHNFTGAYQYHENIQVACRLLFGEVEDSSGGSHDFNVFRLDLRVKTP